MLIFHNNFEIFFIKICKKKFQIKIKLDEKAA